MELNKIQSSGNWGNAADDLNQNFSKVNNAVEQVKNSTTRNKGYFSSSDELIASFPSANKGDIAYVGSAYPYAIWKWNGSSWTNSGSTGGEESVNLGDYYTKEETNGKIAETDEKLSELGSNLYKQVYSGETLGDYGWLNDVKIKEGSIVSNVGEVSVNLYNVRNMASDQYVTIGAGKTITLPFDVVAIRSTSSAGYYELYATYGARNEIENEIKESKLESENKITGLDGNVSELEARVNRHIVIDNLSAYSPFLIRGYIKAGTLIKNNGVAIIIAKSSSLDGRINLSSGQQMLVDEEMKYFQTDSVEGTVDINLYTNVPYSQSVRMEYSRNSLSAYKNLPIVISKGTTIVNHGVGVLIASDGSLADRFDLQTGESFYADTDKSVVRTLAAGDVSIELISLPKKVIHNSHIADKAISTKQVSFIEPLNIVGDVTYGKYYNGTATGSNSLYDVTGYIPVKENQQYCWNVAARFIVLLDSQRNVLRIVEGGFNVITEAGEVYMRVTFYASTDKLYQIEKGDRLSPYTPTSQSFIDKELLPPSEMKINSFKAFRQVAELVNSESLVLPVVNITKNMTMTALLKGRIESVAIGVGLNEYYGLNLTITANDVIVKGGSNNNVVNTISHGLVLNDFAVLEIAKGNDSEARFRITNDTGDLFETAITWGTSIGQPFLKNDSSSVINATFSFFPKDINQSVWMFGDSYFGMYDASRWLYYVIQQWKYNNFLVNAKGGESASGALTDLKNLLSLGATPKYIVWCMGMNGASDTSNGGVNSIWMSVTDEVINICKMQEIELVLATIPSVPERPHVGLNEWVRSSGYRYIDFASAVENGSDYYWKGWGTEDALLSSDEVHPSQKGAAVLAVQAIVDFPEITIAN